MVRKEGGLSKEEIQPSPAEATCEQVQEASKYRDDEQLASFDGWSLACGSVRSDLDVGP